MKITHTRMLSTRAAATGMAGLLWIGAACAQRLPDDVAAPIAQAIKNSNEIYLGWRVFQDKCARCHGPDATGTDKAPDLRVRVKGMSRTAFIGVVLQRYRWALPSSEAAQESGAPDALIQGLEQRQRGELLMPRWESEPSVTAHIADLYDYLQARANGGLAPGRPPWPIGRK